MTTDNKTILDHVLSTHPISCQEQPTTVAPEDLVHVVGAQEPVRDHPDERSRMLLAAGWLSIEYIKIDLPESQRAATVTAVQQAARTWLKQESKRANAADREQVRWLIEKTRPRESKQQISQRVWLAAVLYALQHRGLLFNSEGQIHWDGGGTARIGLAPDTVLDLAWNQASHQTYTASFRHPDGTITRGKGRHRWHIYRLTVNPAAKPLFSQRTKQVDEKIALNVASEIHATQPQLPRDFYGGDAFQQACIDAQDQHFDHILVLSPAHGVLSLDDTVPSEQPWNEILERRIWAWQAFAIQKLGLFLFGEPQISIPQTSNINWWHWINPESVFRFTVFGSGFAVRILLDHLVRLHSQAPHKWPEIIFAEQRPGYHVGDFGDDFDSDFDVEDGFNDELEATLQDIDQLLEWAAEFVELVNVHVPPTGDTWKLAPDEALIPVRLLTETGMDIENLLDLLTDISLLLEQPMPFSMLINANMIVSALLQITHSLVHSEVDSIHEIVNAFPENTLRQYIETTLQETSQEDQLCACLTLAEQMQLIAMSIPLGISDQLLIWLQTYLSSRMRQIVLENENDSPSER